ncbi:MAG TPA: hypothetical protein VG146_11720 [Verrucomicrobiae bacterium]|nr:hypothetical protein [Verrucomicrobiae bacterium]
MGLKPSQSSTTPRSAGFIIVFLLLMAVLFALFHNEFRPGHTLFSNDGPLGTLMSQSHRLPDGFSGGWQDLNSIGFREGGAWPNTTYLLLWVLGPVGYSKLYAPIALFILGLGAWFFFRQLRLAPVACILGALAATLNSGFFSAACWGVAMHPIAIGMNFFALGLLVDTSSPRRWLRVALAGLAVGMGVAEGADIGAIFSLYVAAFIMWQAWTTASGKALTSRLGTGLGRVALVAVFAVFLAAQSMVVLVGTQVKGVAGTQQNTRTKEEKWDWATQWSLPKRETLGLVIPGVFGYRMDTPDGGEYWGAAGRDPSWYRYYANGEQGPKPAGPLRFTGGGNYAGVLVVLVALWAALQAWRKKESAFAPTTQRWLKFWVWAFVLSLLLALGRFAPFYKLPYLLVPFFSTIRNPAKFVHLVNWALVVLFAYGSHGLWRRYMEPATAGSDIARSWWDRLKEFDRRWTLGCLAALGASVLGWLVYAKSQDHMIAYLQQVGFDGATAEAIARFSVGQVGWFILFLAVAVGLITLILSGGLRGPRALAGAVLLCLFVVVDLGRANEPWIKVWDYHQKYATNPILDRLREKPYEHRVALLPFRPPTGLDLINELYRIEWAQHQFLYYNIQSLDVVQMSRMGEDLLAWEMALQPTNTEDMPRLLLKRWELSNTRYLLGPAGYLEVLNQQLDPAQRRFRIAERFQIVPKPGIVSPTSLEEVTAEPATNGTFALFEFTGALPRAKLYAHWQVETNDQATLHELAGASFDPQTTVLVAAGAPPLPSTAATTQNAGAVQFTSYAPKDIVFKADATAPCVLLLNDRFDPNWNVTVDGQPQKLLRCNYLMRGVYLAPGAHRVEFKFQPPMNTFYVSLAAVIVGLLLCGILPFIPGPSEPVDDSAVPLPKPQTITRQPAAVPSVKASGRRNRQPAGKQG